MSLTALEDFGKPRLKALLERFASIEDPREPWRVAHPLPEVLLLAVCGTICDCDDYDAIADWGEAHLAVLRRHLPYHHGVPSGRWLTILMNRIGPALFQAAFTAWVRESWPQRPELVAIDGKTSHRSHDRSVAVAREVDWLSGERRFPGELRLPGVAAIVKVRSRTELKDRCRCDVRYDISSAPLDANRAAEAVRGHWGVENRLHWVLDVVFRDDQSRLRKGHGAKNMAVIRHFALNLVRAPKDKRSIELRRKRAGWSSDYLAEILGLPLR